MSTGGRSPYLEALPPTQRLPDYVPARPAPAAAPVPAAARPAPVEWAAATPPTMAGSEPPEPNAAPAAPAAADKPTVKRGGQISSPVHRVQRATGLAISFTLLVSEGEERGTTYRVYATKQFAERLAKQDLVQGTLVEVAGQPQLREERQPDGSMLAVSYFYCFGVRVLAAAVP